MESESRWPWLVWPRAHFSGLAILAISNGMNITPDRAPETWCFLSG
jgi:hypothetical protein